MSEIETYQDPRLQPPEEPEPTAADWMEECVHRDACRMQWEQSHGAVNTDAFGWMDGLAADLGCGEGCECVEVDDAPRLRRLCARLAESLRVAERMLDAEGSLLDGRMRAELARCGVRA